MEAKIMHIVQYRSQPCSNSDRKMLIAELNSTSCLTKFTRTYIIN